MKYILLLSAMLTYLAFGQNNPRGLDLKWKTDTTKSSVPLNSFTALMYADGIPPIDNPSFYNAEKAISEYFEFEPVIVVEVKGVAKAYPLSVLMFHEIVNDNIGIEGDTTFFTVTYCPLCNSAVVFNRSLEFNNQEYFLDFGVSGMLRKSDMVMYDRQTESWWQQFTGEALVGDLMGAELDFLPSPVLSLSEFFELYPNGTVLSKDNNEDFTYGKNPYVGYDNVENEKPRLFFDEVDGRLPAMERIVDVTVKGEHKIYPLSVVAEKTVLNDVFNDLNIVIFYTDKVVSVLDSADISQSKTIGAVSVFRTEVNGVNLTFKKVDGKFIDNETGSIWNMSGECESGSLIGTKLWMLPHGQHFAFAMLTFHPDCVIYSEE